MKKHVAKDKAAPRPPSPQEQVEQRAEWLREAERRYLAARKAEDDSYAQQRSVEAIVEAARMGRVAAERERAMAAQALSDAAVGKQTLVKSAHHEPTATVWYPSWVTP